MCRMQLLVNDITVDELWVYISKPNYVLCSLSLETTCFSYSFVNMLLVCCSFRLLTANDRGFIFHVFQLLPIRFIQQNFRFISKSIMKHQHESNWELDVHWNNYGYHIGASTVKWTAPDPCLVLSESDSVVCTNILKTYWSKNILKTY